MVDMAVAAGADAVVGFCFDCSEITQSLSEVAAYGTAVDPGAIEGEDQAADATATAGSSRRRSAEPLTPVSSGRQLVAVVELNQPADNLCTRLRMDPMSASSKPGPKKAPEDETKRKFREALEAKQGRRGEDHIDSKGRQSAAPWPVETKRVFRRKTG